MWDAHTIKRLLVEETSRQRGAVLRDVALHGKALYFIFSQLNVKYAIRYADVEVKSGDEMFDRVRRVVSPKDFGEYYDGVHFLYLDRKTYNNLPLQ